MVVVHSPCMSNEDGRKLETGKHPKIVGGSPALDLCSIYSKRGGAGHPKYLRLHHHHCIALNEQWLKAVEVEERERLVILSCIFK